MNPQDKRKHKIKCDYGTSHYYKAYKESFMEAVPNSVYSKILNDFLSQMRDSISQEGYIFNIPQRLGRIELRKNKREVTIDKDGNIKNTLPPNWKATKKLWESNEEARIKKTKIRYINEHTDGYVFRLYYIKNKANFKNKTIYKMSINRAMRRATEQPIITHKLDAFLLNY